jgi:hypothetical protein
MTNQKGFSIFDLAEHDDGYETVVVPVHINEADRLAGKVLRFMFDEMPGDIVTGQAIEVLRTATWWLETQAYVHCARNRENEPNRPTYWQQLAGEEAQ